MSADSDYVIDLRDVDKVYRGKVHALRGIEMRVHRGEIFGLLGPNGAGKSTLVKILMTIIRATHCEGTMLSAPLGNRAALARVGYLPEHLRFPDYLTGEQVMDYMGALAKVPAAVRRQRTDELLELVKMSEWRSRKVKTYSKGMRQRIGVAQALINDPELVLLDEPTDGVDPVGRRDIRNVLLEMKGRGKTVFINSHLLSELEMVCDRVAILRHGDVVQQGTIDELTRSSRRYEIGLAGPLPEGGELERLLSSVEAKTEPGEKARITLFTEDAASVQPVIDALRQAGGVIESIRPVRQSLEDLFMAAVEGQEDGKPAVGAAPEVKVPAAAGKPAPEAVATRPNK